MKVIVKIAAIAAALLSLASCEEFQPVFTGKYDGPSPEEIKPFPHETMSIQEFVAKFQPKMYANAANPPEGEIISPEEPYYQIDEEIYIKGVVTSTDQPGNFYKSLYIQDETAGIEIKFGKNALYNDYKLGQTLYISCQNLYLGEYKHKRGAGSISLGCKTTNPLKYPNSYMELPAIIDMHVTKGEKGEPVAPKPITAAELPGPDDTQAQNGNIGRYVTISGATYAKEVFSLIYLDSNKDKDRGFNRIFLSSPFNSDEKYTWDITSWAMNKEIMAELLQKGTFDTAEVGSGGARYGTVAERKNPKIAIRGIYVPGETKEAHCIEGEIVFVEGVTPSYGEYSLYRADKFVEEQSGSTYTIEGLIKELPEDLSEGFEIICYDSEMVYDEEKNKFVEVSTTTPIKVLPPSNFEKFYPQIKKVMGTYPGIERAPASVSQYFNVGGKTVQVRTSGFSKFGGEKIPEAVLNGTQTVDLTGIISMYEGKIQFTLIDLETGVKYN